MPIVVIPVAIPNRETMDMDLMEVLIGFCGVRGTAQGLDLAFWEEVAPLFHLRVPPAWLHRLALENL